MLQATVVHDQHNQVNVFDPDLQSPTAAANRGECGSAPAFRCAAGGHSTSVLGAKDEATFDQVGHYDDALCTVQHFFRDAFVGSRHYRLENIHGFLHAI